MTDSSEETAQYPEELAHVADQLSSLLLPEHSIGIAVSGGPDSLALMHLVAHSGAIDHDNIIVLTVDHGLRAQSAEECEFVNEQAAKLGLRCETLQVKSEISDSDVQNWARKERYRLLFEACQRHHLQKLLLAHHRDDQIETFFLRLARGSGLRGLAAMNACVSQGEFDLIRPLLNIPKSALVAYLDSHNISYISDPSNTQAKFDRVKWRTLLPDMQEAGLGLKDIQATLQRLQQADNLIQEMLNLALGEDVIVYPHGVICLDAKRFTQRHQELQFRMMNDLLRSAGGQSYGPRSDQIGLVLAKINSLHADEFSREKVKLSLAGCLVEHDGKNNIWIYREIGRSPPDTLKITRDQKLWDGRFLVQMSNANTTRDLDFTIGPLLDHSLEWRSDLKQMLPDMPASAMLSLPVVWKNDICLGVAGLHDIEDIDIHFLGPSSSLWKQI